MSDLIPIEKKIIIGGEDFIYGPDNKTTKEIEEQERARYHIGNALGHDLSVCIKPEWGYFSFYVDDSCVGSVSIDTVLRSLRHLECPK